MKSPGASRSGAFLACAKRPGSRHSARRKNLDNLGYKGKLRETFVIEQLGNEADWRDNEQCRCGELDHSLSRRRSGCERDLDEHPLARVSAASRACRTCRGEAKPNARRAAGASGA